MKWIIAALFILVGATASIGQTISLNDEQQKEFNRKALFIDGTSTYGSGPLNFWTVRQGFEKISESMFYEIAGYPTEARKAADYKNVSWGLTIGGATCAVVGTVLYLNMLLGPGPDSGDPDYDTKSLWWMIGGFSGLGLQLIAPIPITIGATRLMLKWSSAEMARSAADDYNAKLTRSLDGN